LIALIVAGRRSAGGEENWNEDRGIAFLRQFGMEAAIAVGQRIAKVEIQEDDGRRAISREIGEFGDEPARRIVSWRLRLLRGQRVLVRRPAPFLSRIVVDIDEDDRMRVIQKMDLWRMKHVVGMVLRDDEPAKRGKIHRPQKVCETLYE
jgi:Arc/MetJ family transcription regulator